MHLLTHRENHVPNIILVPINWLERTVDDMIDNFLFIAPVQRQKDPSLIGTRIYILKCAREPTNNDGDGCETGHIPNTVHL